jgi:hypothetical protein
VAASLALASLAAPAVVSALTRLSYKLLLIQTTAFFFCRRGPAPEGQLISRLNLLFAYRGAPSDLFRIKGQAVATEFFASS